MAPEFRNLDFCTKVLLLMTDNYDIVYPKEKGGVFVSVKKPPKTQSSSSVTSKTVYDSEDVFTVLSSESDKESAQEAWREPLPETVDTTRTITIILTRLSRI